MRTKHFVALGTMFVLADRFPSGAGRVSTELRLLAKRFAISTKRIVMLRVLLILATATQASYAQIADEATLQAAGIRTIKSRHLTLYTDLPASPEIDQLPLVFDLAIPRWATFFRTDASVLADWRVDACVMRDGKRFEGLRLVA